MLWMLRKILLLLSSEKSPAQLAAGVAFGFLMGLVPAGNLIWFALLALVMLLRVNLAMWTTAMVVTKALAWPLDFAIIAFGDMVLHRESLRSFFTAMFNTSVVAISGFNRPSVMGGLVLGAAAFAPAHFLAVVLIRYYRRAIMPKLDRFWIIRLLKGSNFYRFYSNYSD